MPTAKTYVRVREQSGRDDTWRDREEVLDELRYREFSAKRSLHSAGGGPPLRDGELIRNCPDVVCRLHFLESSQNRRKSAQKQGGGLFVSRRALALCVASRRHPGV